METELLLSIHSAATPFLDVLFRVSHELGGYWFSITLLVLAVAMHLRLGEVREASLWILLGVTTYVMQLGLKVLIARDRPDLWIGPIEHANYAMPSGHALAAATFYPLLARVWVRRRPEHAVVAFAAAGLMAFYVGFGRLYLGVHWPTDVLVGWLLGVSQTIVAIRLTAALPRTERERG